MKKAKIILAIIGVILVAILATVGILYARIFDPLWNPFRPEPMEVIKEMEKKMDKVKFFHSKIDFEMLAENEEKIKISGKFSTDNDTRDPKVPKSKGNFDFSLSYDGISISFGGEIIVVGENLFLKITKSPPKEFFEGMKKEGIEIDFFAFKDKWIKIDSESLMEWIEKYLPKEEMPLLPLRMEEIFEKFAQKQKELEEKMKKEIEERLAFEKVFLIKEELPDKKIDEIKTYHYLLTLNKGEVKELTLEMVKIYIDFIFEAIFEVFPEPLRPSPEKIEKAKREMIEELKKELDKIFEKIGEIPFEVWIGKKDFLLYRLKFEKEIDIEKITEGKEKGRFSIKMEINNSRFNLPVEIKEPEKFKLIGEILEGIIGPAIKRAQSRARDAKRMSHMMQIQTAMEMYYSEQNKYLASKTMPERIGLFLLEMPKDPGSGPCPEYQWISNLKNPKKFCVFACLENGNFYAVSHKGIKELEEPPRTLDCW